MIALTLAKEAAMPWGWFTFSTASTPAGKRCAEDPHACREELGRDLASCGAELLDLYFDADDRVARALAKDLDNPICRKGLIEKWGARYWKLLTVEEAAEGFRHARRLEEEPGAEYTGS
jgi:hypothetical protein